MKSSNMSETLLFTASVTCGVPYRVGEEPKVQIFMINSVLKYALLILIDVHNNNLSFMALLLRYGQL